MFNGATACEMSRQWGGILVPLRNCGRGDDGRSFVLMRHFSFNTKVIKFDGRSKGRWSHRAHVARRGDKKLARWLTFALNQRTRGVNVSSDGVNKGLGGACNAHMTLLAAFIALSDLQISVRSRGNRSTWRFTCLESVAEDSIQGRCGWRWCVWGWVGVADLCSLDLYQQL